MLSRETHDFVSKTKYNMFEYGDYAIYTGENLTAIFATKTTKNVFINSTEIWITEMEKKYM